MWCPYAKIMFNDCKIFIKNNITIISPNRVAKIHNFEFDEIFFKDLTQSRKKICVFRNYNHNYLPQLEQNCHDFDIVFLEVDAHDAFTAPLSTKFIVVSNDMVFENKVQKEFIPFDWYRTTTNYGKVNKKLWKKSKEYYLTARMNVPRPWKVELLKQIIDKKCLTWSALQVHDLIPGSPKTFESEKHSMNHELPSQEQILSWSLLCLECNDYMCTEKSYQHLYHLSPTIWHTSRSILDLEQFGFAIKFNGFDYSYLDMPPEQKISTLVKQIQSMTEKDFIDFHHQNIKETENNHKIMKDINNFYRFFSPKIQQYL